MDLKGKGCIVTGGFGVLAGAVAKALATAGAKVALIDRIADPPPGLADRVGNGAICIGNVDLADPAAAKRAIDDAAKRLGGLHALVNIAGTFKWETLADGDLATWDFLYTVNLKTAAATSKAALAHLKEGGRIVNIGAGAAAKAAAGMGAYTASKAGVAKLTEALSEEVKAKGITVNAILPSIIDTPQNRKDMADADFSKWVQPEAIGDIIVFLVSDKARAITGASIPAPGLV